MTTSQGLTILRASWILRGLRANPDVRLVLNNLADTIVLIAQQETVVGIRAIVADIRELRDNLNNKPTLDDMIMAQALEGVTELLMTVL